MTNLKNFFLFVLLCFVITSNAQSGFNYQTIRSGLDGSIIGHIPFPAGWQVIGPVSTGQPYIQGPEGTMVTSSVPEIYFCDVSPQAMQSIQMSGKPVANMIPLATILQQHIQPAVQQQGGRLLKSYRIPQLKQRMDQRLQKAAQTGGFQFAGSELLATEWNAPGGKKSLIVLVSFKVRSSKGFSVWSLNMEELEAPVQVFDQVKHTYLDAQSNLEPDNRAIAARAAQHRQDQARIAAEGQARLNASAAAHQARMRDINAAGAANAAVNRTGEDILDIGMQGYNNRSAMTSTGQANSVNGIHGENTVISPYNGHEVQVDYGYNRTFIGPNNQVYQTDDMDFSPERSEQFRFYREVNTNH